MDKIVKHRFWILLALVPPLVVFGYYNANSAINAATKSAIDGLESTFNAIPQGNGPNPTWVKAADGGIEVYNQAIEKAVTAEKVRVWTDQLPRMTWPVKMESFVPRTPSGMLNYRAEFPREAGFTYKAGYTDQLEALYQSIEPLKQEKGGGVSGKVHLNRSAIPRHTFGLHLISSEEIWDSQEDLWLLQLLFDSVRGVNRTAENAAKSAVRRLSEIRLMGGDGNSTVRGAMGGTGGMGDGPRGMAGGGGDEDFVGIISAAGRGGPMNMGQVNVRFDPSEEFGVGFEGMAGGSSSGVGDEDVMNVPGRMADMAGRGGMAGLGGLGASQKEIRYIKFDANAAFRERGFYMSVLIDQRKIADFLVELSNADWPIRIVRFNVGPNGGTSSGGMGGYGAPSRFGVGPADMDDMASPLGMLRGTADFGSGSFGGANFGGGNVGAGAPAGPGDFGFGGDDLFNAPLRGGADGDELDPRGMGLAGGVIGPSPLVQGDQIGDLFLHPDLVQLDVCGVITMYNPPAADVLAAVEAAASGGAGSLDATVPAAGAEGDVGSAVAPAGDPLTAEPVIEGAGAGTTAEPAAEGSAEPAAGNGELEASPAPATDAAAPGDTSTTAEPAAPEATAPGT